MSYKCFLSKNIHEFGVWICRELAAFITMWFIFITALPQPFLPQFSVSGRNGVVWVPFYPNLLVSKCYYFINIAILGSCISVHPYMFATLRASSAPHFCWCHIRHSRLGSGRKFALLHILWDAPRFHSSCWCCQARAKPKILLKFIVRFLLQLTNWLWNGASDLA